MARRKQQALAVPQSEAEAIALVEAYVGREREVLQLQLSAEMAIDKLKADRDTAIATIGEQLKQDFAALKAWWEAEGHKLAKDRRSAELAGAKLGIRLSPPKVKLPRGIKDAAIVQWLLGLRWASKGRFLRTKVELDKPAIIKAHQAEEDVRRMFAKAGVGVVQADEFFIDAGLDPDAVRKELAGE